VGESATVLLHSCVRPALRCGRSECGDWEELV
jgi:hypothetical protein